jgi:regulatory protein
MENESSAKKALDAAYRFLARRPHSMMELKRKLSKKGFCADLTENTIDSLCQQGYLNDEEVSLRWAQSLVQGRGWGKAKITFYLLQKGISRDIIEIVEKKIWQEFSEEEIARKALKKRFSPYREIPPQGKMVTFLKSRGFSSEVIFKVAGCLTLTGSEIIE